MMKITDTVNVIYGVIVAFLTTLLGQYWFLFAGLLIFNVVDWITGWYYARVNGLSSSKVGAMGAVKKLSYWLVIGIAFFIANTFIDMGNTMGVNLNFMVGIGWFVLANYLVNEIRSILENLVKLGVDVPSFLINGLAIVSETIDKADELTDKIKRGDTNGD